MEICRVGRNTCLRVGTEGEEATIALSRDSITDEQDVLAMIPDQLKKEETETRSSPSGNGINWLICDGAW